MCRQGNDPLVIPSGNRAVVLADSQTDIGLDGKAFVRAMLSFPAFAG